MESQIKVKRIYFIENDKGISKHPVFELENGMIKRPYIKTKGFGSEVLWLTKDEFQLKKKKLTSKKWYQKIF